MNRIATSFRPFMNLCSCQLDININVRPKWIRTFPKKLSNKVKHLFEAAGWQSDQGENPSTRKSEFKPPMSASVRPTGVSLRKSLNTCRLQGRCGVADPDLWPLTSNIKNFPEGINKISHHPQAADPKSSALCTHQIHHTLSAKPGQTDKWCTTAWNSLHWVFRNHGYSFV